MLLPHSEKKKKKQRVESEILDLDTAFIYLIALLRLWGKDFILVLPCDYLQRGNIVKSLWSS